MAPRSKEDTRLLWRQAFRQVIDQYTEFKSSHGEMQALDYEKVMTRTPGGGANTKVVRPSITDFIADVELAARRVLKGSDLEQFENVYVHGKYQENHFASDTFIYIQETLGKVFKGRGIFPTAAYFKPKDTR